MAGKEMNELVIAMSLVGVLAVFVGGTAFLVKRKKRMDELWETGDQLCGIILNHLISLDFGMRHEIKIVHRPELAWHRGGYRWLRSDRVAISIAYNGNTDIDAIKENILPEIMKFLREKPGCL